MLQDLLIFSRLNHLERIAKINALTSQSISITSLLNSVYSTIDPLIHESEANKSEFIEALLQKLNELIQLNQENPSCQIAEETIKDFMIDAADNLSNFSEKLFNFCLKFFAAADLQAMTFVGKSTFIKDKNQTSVVYRTTLYMHLAFLFCYAENGSKKEKIKGFLRDLSKVLVFDDFILDNKKIEFQLDSQSIKWVQGFDSLTSYGTFEPIQLITIGRVSGFPFIPSSVLPISNEVFSYHYITEYLERHLDQWDVPNMRARVEDLQHLIDSSRSRQASESGLYFANGMLESKIFEGKESGFNHRNWIKLFKAEPTDWVNHKYIRPHELMDFIALRDRADFIAALGLAEEFIDREDVESDLRYKSFKPVFQKLVVTWRKTALPNGLSADRAFAVLIHRLINAEKISDIDQVYFKRLVDACEPLKLVEYHSLLQLDVAANSKWRAKTPCYLSVYLYCLSKGATSWQIERLLDRMGLQVSAWVSHNTVDFQCEDESEHRLIYTMIENYLLKTAPLANKYLLPLYQEKTSYHTATPITEFILHIGNQKNSPFAPAISLAASYMGKLDLKNDNVYQQFSMPHKMLTMIWSKTALVLSLGPNEALRALIEQCVFHETVANIDNDLFKHLVSACNPEDLTVFSHLPDDPRVSLTVSNGSDTYYFSVYLFCLKKGATPWQIERLLDRMGVAAKPWVSFETIGVSDERLIATVYAEAEKYLFKERLAKKYLVPVFNQSSASPFSFMRLLCFLEQEVLIDYFNYKNLPHSFYPREVPTLHAEYEIAKIYGKNSQDDFTRKLFNRPAPEVSEIIQGIEYDYFNHAVALIKADKKNDPKEPMEISMTEDFDESRLSGEESLPEQVEFENPRIRAINFFKGPLKALPHRHAALEQEINQENLNIFLGKASD